MPDVENNSTKKQDSSITFDPPEIAESFAKNPQNKKGYLLRLFVVGANERSLRAIANIRQICEEHLAGNYSLEIIDVYEDPAASKQEQIIAAPTLVQKKPEPRRVYIGDLGDREALLRNMGLASSK